MFVRFVGLIVAIDFFYDTGEHKFKMLIFGWSFWVITGIFAILVNLFKENGLNEILLLFNVLFGTLGAIFNLWGMFEFYVSVPYKSMKLFIVLTILITILFYLMINLFAAMIFCIIILNISIFSAFIVPPLRKKKFKQFMGKSIRWYYLSVLSFFTYFPISVFISTMGYGYGVYNTNDPIIIMLNYLPTIFGTILLIVLYVHLEYTVSNRQKEDLRDKYSHNLGNILQSVMSSIDLLEMNHNQKKDIKSNIELAKERTKEAAEVIRKIRNL